MMTIDDTKIQDTFHMCYKKLNGKVLDTGDIKIMFSTINGSFFRNLFYLPKSILFIISSIKLLLITPKLLPN